MQKMEEKLTFCLYCLRQSRLLGCANGKSGHLGEVQHFYLMHEDLALAEIEVLRIRKCILC